MILTHWRIITDTNKPEGARVLVSRLQKHANLKFDKVKVESYHKGGHVVTFDLSHEFDDWIAGVYDVIQCAQRMGYNWSLTGSIDEEFDLHSNSTSISGITGLSCFCPRPGSANAK